MLGPMQVLYIYLMPAHAHIFGTQKPTWNLQLNSHPPPLLAPTSYFRLHTGIESFIEHIANGYRYSHAT